MSAATASTSTFLEFNDPMLSDSGKTWVIGVKSAGNPSQFLGTIKWFGAWRRYVFHPESNTLFDAGCLSAIQTKINELMAERKKKS